MGEVGEGHYWTWAVGEAAEEHSTPVKEEAEDHYWKGAVEEAAGEHSRPVEGGVEGHWRPVKRVAEVRLRLPEEEAEEVGWQRLEGEVRAWCWGEATGERSRPEPLEVEVVARHKTRSREAEVEEGPVHDWGLSVLEVFGP